MKYNLLCRIDQGYFTKIYDNLPTPIFWGYLDISIRDHSKNTLTNEGRGLVKYQPYYINLKAYVNTKLVNERGRGIKIFYKPRTSKVDFRSKLKPK